ncbi:Phosphoinositide phosphatase SAC4-like protein [Drosera capensis]
MENMGVGNEHKLHASLAPPQHYMQKFRLYETRSKFYMIGRDKSRTYWRVLTIDRSDPYELNLHEDSTTYTENECSELLGRIHEGNKAIGGLKLMTTCYGIIGPYYMLVITKRRKIGAICGHTIYAISKSVMVPLRNSVLQSNVEDTGVENRYKKLLSMVDLTKDFYFSYSYHVMRSLQKNLCDHKTGQATLSVAGKDFKLTLIARRSRHYAGTRYLKRGVNEKGRVANDVETEQIVFEEVPEGSTVRVSSVVQNRGSIPLFWSQETSRLNLKPDIILSKKDQNYEATRLHFENLVMRYGNPIIILNLIKTNEKKPRESILRAEFANAIEVINKDLSEEDQLKFLHWDLHKHAHSKATNVLLLLGKIAAYALTLTGFFYCQLPPSTGNLNDGDHSTLSDSGTDNGDAYKGETGNRDGDRNANNGETININGITCESFTTKKPMFQKGVLRTNCIDCLDRTNVAQYAYGLAALGNQLHALGVTNVSKVDLDESLADELMKFYERMGDTLAHQYGGSAAHNKIFSQRRGQWKAATQSQEFFRTLQRYYSNAYLDAEKQNAINLFLGYFEPQRGKPALWEMSSDQLYGRGRNELVDIEKRRAHKRCWSEGNILRGSNTSPSALENFPKLVLNDQADGIVLLESSPDISASENAVAHSRYTPSLPSKQLFRDINKDQSLGNNHARSMYELGDYTDLSNFVDLDWLSSSGNSCGDDSLDRSTHTISPVTGLSSEDVINGLAGETPPSSSAYGSGMKVRDQTGTDLSYDGVDDSVLEEFSDSFVRWVNQGETLCY